MAVRIYDMTNVVERYDTPLNPLSRGDLKVTLRVLVLNRFFAALRMTVWALGMTAWALGMTVWALRITIRTY